MPADPQILLQGWMPLLGLVVALLAPVLPNIYNGWHADRNAKAAAALAKVAVTATELVAAKLDESDAKNTAKLDEIHSLVNGRLMTALAKVEDLEQRLFEAENGKFADEQSPSQGTVERGT
jgi:hypothetical protein